MRASLPPDRLVARTGALRAEAAVQVAEMRGRVVAVAAAAEGAERRLAKSGGGGDRTSR